MLFCIFNVRASCAVLRKTKYISEQKSDYYWNYRYLASYRCEMAYIIIIIKMVRFNSIISVIIVIYLGSGLS